MIGIRTIWAVAQSEGRLTRRLARYWVFLVMAGGLGLLAFFYYSAIHAFASAISPTIGLINPRYLVSAIGTAYLTGFTIGVVFLGFDVRARDEREGIVEVLDTRPLTNLELLAGRYLGLFLHAWAPLVLLALLIEALGWLMPLLGSPVGRSIEPVSLFGFTTALAIPGLAFSFAVVFFITLLVRHRLVAALLSVAVMACLYWATIVWPATWVPYVDFLGLTMMDFPSDIVPSMLRPEGWWQRLGMLLLALALIGFAVVIHPRLDGGDRKRAAAAAVAVLAAGLLALNGAAQIRSGNLARAERWHDAHAARTGEPVADIQSMTGSVRIDPGKALTVSLRVQVQAPPDQDLAKLLFTFNPGLQVDRAAAGGAAMTVAHQDGLLELQPAQPLHAGATLDLELDYHGRPEIFFAYLDSALKLENIKATDAQVGILGFEPAIFDRRYVALMPGIHWLPAAGVDVGREDGRARRRDYFHVDIEVAVPADWIVSGPGRRKALGGDGDRARFRYAPAVSLPEVALLAAPFERYATEIKGVEFEVLFHPAHDANFALLAEARGEVESWIADKLQVYEQAGLPYPLDAFSLVEVPTRLRGYQGGWRLNTAMAPPGMVLMRESSFPTARFDFDIGNSFGNKRDYDREGGKPRIERDRLISYFNNDVSGGNLFTGAAQSIYVHRTAAYGPDAIAVDFTLEQLAALLLSGQRGYFSAHLFTSINSTATSVIASIQGRGATSVSDALITALTTQTKTWDAALQTPLSGIDPWADPQRTIDVLTLKGGKLAQAIYDTLGPATTGELLAEIVERHAGSTFTRADLIAAAAGVGGDIGPLLDDWFGTTSLPGFVADNVRLYRLPDTANGDSAYQLLLRLRNDEPVTGFTRVAWSMTAATSQQINPERTRGNPIRVPGRSAVEFGVVLSEPPAAVYLEPYLSLNREDFLVQTFNQDEIPERHVEPINGVAEVPWDSGSDDRIIVDDLDPGFSIIRGGPEGGMRLLGRAIDAGTDQGLPVATGQGLPREWSRRAGRNTWGRYRHTLAYTRPGTGTTRAVLAAQIPRAGYWELEFHLPLLPFIPVDQRGVWRLDIVTADGREATTFNANGSNMGWNLVGEFYLPAGDARVEISDQTEGRLVVADAIAWSPVRKQDPQSAAAESAP
jgi:ABC-type transport system involved in multi-copper enzyme maturation permease subunit